MRGHGGTDQGKGARKQPEGSAKNQIRTVLWSYCSQTKIKSAENDESLSFSALRKQVAGIEPVSPAWEAGILPMYYTCRYEKNYIRSFRLLQEEKS